MIEQKIESLRYRSEGADLDFKQEQYKFIGAEDHDKAEMLKDILGFANAWREGPAYILVGLKDSRPHPAKVLGIAQSFDDATLQQFVNSKLNRTLNFTYEEHLLDGKTIGIFTIPKQKRPFFLKKRFSKLKEQTVYTRLGSSTVEASPDEVAAMGAEDIGREEMRVDLTVTGVNGEPLPDTIALEYIRLPKDLPDFCFNHTTRAPTIFQATAGRPNRNFWREHGEFLRIDAALIEMRFSLRNRSALQLSNPRLEVRVESLDGQTCRILGGRDLPDVPKREWNIKIGNLNSVLREEARLDVDCEGTASVCRVRFLSLFPGEEAISADNLVLIPSAPGSLRIRLRIFAPELPAPQEHERIIDTLGDVVQLDLNDLDNLVLTGLRRSARW